MAGYGTPKEMHHPDGAKLLLAYSSDDESAILKQFAAWRLAEAEANDAAVQGREIKKPAPPTPTLSETDPLTLYEDPTELRRGSGRPRKIEEIV